MHYENSSSARGHILQSSEGGVGWREALAAPRSSAKVVQWGINILDSLQSCEIWLNWNSFMIGRNIRLAKSNQSQPVLWQLQREPQPAPPEAEHLALVRVDRVLREVVAARPRDALRLLWRRCQVPVSQDTLTRSIWSLASCTLERPGIGGCFWTRGAIYVGSGFYKFWAS